MVEKQLTDKEKIEKLRREERNKAAYAAVQDALSLIDLTQTKSITYNTYSRDALRTYLKRKVQHKKTYLQELDHN